MRRTKLVPTAWGVHLAPTSDVYVTASLDLYGEYSPEEAARLVSYVQPGRAVVVVGAHCGTLAAPLAVAVGPTGTVVAYEPQAFLADCLTATKMLNDWPQLTVRPLAVSAAPGVTQIPDVNYGAPGNYGSVSIGDGTRDVLMVTLDTDCARVGPVGLLVIDVEGHEMAVLTGAEAIITRDRPIISAECDREGAIDALRTWATAHDYRAWLWCPPLYSPGNFRRCDLEPWGHVVSQDALLVPAEHAQPDDLEVL